MRTELLSSVSSGSRRSNATFSLNSHFIGHNEVRQTSCACFGFARGYQVEYRPWAFKGSVQMANNIETKKAARKAWAAPELRRLSAGSAEAGNGTIADGGAPTAPRS